jgi:hypothetical protein
MYCDLRVPSLVGSQAGGSAVQTKVNHTGARRAAPGKQKQKKKKQAPAKLCFS